jgi:hypothetical protein
MDILQAIGNTSLVRLGKIARGEGAAIFAKLEWENPTGSMKDRMTLAVISRAEQDGRLRPGDTVLEIHRRQHRGVARPGLRGQGLPAEDRHLRCVQPGKARPHGSAPS